MMIAVSGLSCTVSRQQLHRASKSGSCSCVSKSVWNLLLRSSARVNFVNIAVMQGPGGTCDF